MDTKSLSLGERIAAGSGAALLLFLFVSWIEGQNAWELFKIVDVLLALLAVAAVALSLAKAAGYELPLRPSNRTILIRIGAVALIVILAYFLEALGRAQVGLWLSVLAAGGILYGGASTPADEPSSRRRPRERRPLAEEGIEEPPPGMESWRGAGARSGAAGERGSSSSGSGSEAEAEGAVGDTAGRDRGQPPAADERGSWSSGGSRREQSEVRRPRRFPEDPPSRERR